jgi:YVTN family beta-propeller protein
MQKKILFVFVISLFSLFLLQCTSENTNSEKSDLRLVGPQEDGSFVVPSNQTLRPAGKQIYFPGRPVDMAFSLDNKWLVVLNKSSLELISVRDSCVKNSLHIGGGTSFKGLSFSEDGKYIYASQARDRIVKLKITENNELKLVESIVFPKPEVGGHPVPGGFTLSKDNTELYVPLNRSNSLAIVNIKTKLIKEIQVGVAPFEAVLFSKNKAYVSNWGGRRVEQGESSYKSSGTEVLVDPKTGIANNGTVSLVDLKAGKEIKSIEVGLHPTAMVLSSNDEHLFVACANSDFISVIETSTNSVINEISVKLDKSLPFGSAPNALTISKDGKFLYVANGTDNAICVIDLANSNKVLGFIPTGWYPGSVILDSEEKNLIIANTKGIGSRNLNPDKKGYNSHNHLGSISILPVPDKTQLLKMTSVVKENNSFAKTQKKNENIDNENGPVTIPQFPAQTSRFKHVVYIIKENRTYDQVFGDMPQGNGDTSLVHFGREVTPNHHALAEEFVLMDNYYCSGILSADGHQWTDEAYVTDYIEKFFGDFPRSYPYSGGDPIAYSPAGFIWDNVLNHGLTFRNYGEFVSAIIEPKTSTFSEIFDDYKNGTNKIKIRAKVNLPQLEEYTCPTFIGFPEKVSDVYRAGEFIKELEEFEENDNFPNFIIMLLPNDHTSGTRPGLPTPRAAVADNDLALGRVVEAISKSKFWNETCIFVTEDDPQAGLDHVDGHRTVGLVVSPYTKRGEVVSTNYTQINMFRTIENILGIPPLNQFDLAALPMNDCFTEQGDFTSYNARPNKISLEELNPSLAEITGKQLHFAQKSLEQNLDEYDQIEEDIFNRIIWHSVKGYDVPYPLISTKN